MTHAEWEALLDRFEQDLADTAAPHAWTRPNTTLPPELADRARTVVTCQDQRIRQLRDALDELRGQIAALRQVPGMRGDTPVLLDVDL
jgi:hypothetical protein